MKENKPVPLVNDPGFFSMAFCIGGGTVAAVGFIGILLGARSAEIAMCALAGTLIVLGGVIFLAQGHAEMICSRLDRLIELKEQEQNAQSTERAS